MLKEFHNVRQHKEGYRRLFSDDFFDLFIWYVRQNDEPIGFQLCYNKKYNEHSLTWQRGTGFYHNRIDSGEGDPLANRSPVLVADGVFDSKAIAERFLENSRDIDDGIVQFVYSRLLKFPV